MEGIMGKKRKKRRPAPESPPQPEYTSRKRTEKKQTTRIDMHTHTPGSDGRGKPSEFVKHLEASGMDGIIITDHHNTLTRYGYLVAEAIQAAGYFVMLGCEYSTKDGHCLVYGVDVARFDLGFYPSMQELIDRVHEEGGVAFPSHPYRGYKYILKDDIFKLEGLTHCETLNGQNAVAWPRDNQDAIKAAKVMDLFSCGGSDAHTPSRIGTCFTEFEGDIRTPADLLVALKAGQHQAKMQLSEVQRQKRDRHWSTTSSSWFSKADRDQSSSSTTTKGKVIRLVRSGMDGIKEFYYGSDSGDQEDTSDLYDDRDESWEYDQHFLSEVDWRERKQEEHDAFAKLKEEETFEERIQRWQENIFLDHQDEQEAIEFFLSSQQIT